ncbi:MAG: Penicillin-binding protein, 1A family [Candidatus Magasanikbacteria bacterium GW2011_GWC2_37_14]|uniref:Penicillin-binding protein, 1A family n=1 Tax=Candidatus Magasanikbacteria bacterium GW2011_GWC2_37_14 TaxID=1619046 RepID=A0A0G0G717_9BACT|nr:MAG: Penicillin-binding protein, 1A family [Candidatus Magasanikbacteria bacterium GW2011_GWC2_37_14]
MSTPQLKRRSYGFRGNNSSRTEHREGEVYHQERSHQKKANFWFKLAIFPFILLWKILQGLFWLWKKRPKLSQKNKKALRQRLGVLIITGIVFCLLFGTITIAWVSKDLPDPDKLTDRKVAESTKIYDRTGEHLLYEVFTDQKRTLVTLEQIPKNLINGVIATEDTQFYQHLGVRPLSFVRAIIYGIFTSKKIGGTSTLTQQLVKNAILTSERSYLRKLKEVILSLRLEQKYSKDQILQIYFNEIPYGSTNYGAESAALSYFGKQVSELNLQESATLAGLPQSPSYFLNNPDALKQRRDFVLRRMYEEKYISEAEKNTAQKEPLTLQRHFNDIVAPHFVMYVKQQLVEKYGEQMVDTGGLKVLTTLDYEKQLVAENAVSSSAKILDEGQSNNASLVALDPKTGQVLAMVGSRDFNNEKIKGQFNVATLGLRQPGSSFKPIIYSAAFEKGFTPDTLLWDVETNFAASGNPYTPQDYDGGERGPVTMRQALQGSLNIPAVQTLYLVGDKKGVEFAERLGYTTLSQGEFGLTLVLGGGEVKLIEHTAAFGLFANNGKKNETVSILQVEDADGSILSEWHPSEGEQVLDQKITDTISNVLSDDPARAYVFGAGGILTLKDRPVAVKTGTTNNYVDAWTVGYTPSLVAGVWVGNTDNTPMRKGDGGSKLAAPIWNKFMAEVLKNTPVESFPPLPENTATKAILHGMMGGGVSVKLNKLNGKLATSSTPPELIEEQTFAPAHSILYYVNKDDPQGPAPANPADDPQYTIWENAIQSWINRMKIKNPNFSINFAEPPTELDDGSTESNLPSLEILFPQNGQALNSRDLNIQIKTSAPRGVVKASYQMDSSYIGVAKDYPFNLHYYARSFVDGPHTLKVIVEDEAGIKVEKQAQFVFVAGEEQPAVFFTEDSFNLQSNNFPYLFQLNNYRLADVAELKIYLEQNGVREVLLSKNTFTDLFNNQITFRWTTAPLAGEYQIIVELKLKNGKVLESDRVSVAVE